MTQRATLRPGSGLVHGNFVYFVTFNVDNRRWFFVTPERAEVLGRAIQTSCVIKQFMLFGYCILPNHVHMMVAPRAMIGNYPTPQCTRGRARCGVLNKDQQFEMTRENSSFLYAERRRPRRRSLSKPQKFTYSDLMHTIKSTFSHALDQGKFWQHRSHFRLVTSQEEFNNKINYIRFNYRKMNPVRAPHAVSADLDVLRTNIKHRSNGMNLPESYGQQPWVHINWHAIQLLQ